MLSDLLDYVRSNDRVCPQPQKWNELWEMLPDRRRAGEGWEPSLPLILDAWWDTPATAVAGLAAGERGREASTRVDS